MQIIHSLFCGSLKLEKYFTRRKCPNEIESKLKIDDHSPLHEYPVCLCWKMHRKTLSLDSQGMEARCHACRLIAVLTSFSFMGRTVSPSHLRNDISLWSPGSRQRDVSGQCLLYYHSDIRLVKLKKTRVKYGRQKGSNPLYH